MISQQLLVLHWGEVKQVLDIRGSRVAATSRRAGAQTAVRRSLGRAKSKSIGTRAQTKRGNV